jgi:hypothetical protein
VSGLTAAESQALTDIDANVDANTTTLGAVASDISGIETSIISIEGSIVTIQTNIGTIQTDIATAEAILRNKRIISPSTGVETLYADDSVTPLLDRQVYEDAAGTQPYQGQGHERTERFETP